MKKGVKFLIKLCILIIISLLIYFNYGAIKSKIDSWFNDAINYASEKGIIDIEGIGSFINDADLKSLTDTGITGDSLSFSSTYYPYYELLNANERKIYKQVYANARELKKSFVPVVNVNTEELKNVVYAVNYDHPELFYLDTSYGYKYTGDNVIAQILLNYNSTANDITYAKAAFDREANKIISGANSYKSNYEKEKYVHDALVKSVEYNTGSSLNQSAYSALVNKRSVCAGYARSFQYIMTELGIPTYYVTGVSDGEGPHAWNLISLSDGFYNVDVTFDDTTHSYRYFNLDEETFRTNHIRTDISVSLPGANGSKFLGYRKVKGYVNNGAATLD